MTFRDDARLVTGQLSRYLDQSRNKEKKVINQAPISAIQENLNLDAFIKKGGLTGDALSTFLETYLDYTTRLHHPGYMAHQVGIPHPTGALASFIDGITNNAMAIYEMGPAAAAIEFYVVNYLLEKIGWNPMPEKVEDRLTFDHGGGVLTHGGSLANMTALLAARNRLDPQIRETGDTSNLVILAPESSHYIISKTAGIIGIGEHHVIPLGTDDMGRILPDRIETAINKARSDGKRIVALTANGCATGTGLYDDLDAIGTICNTLDVWFHVDGAHGACALFSQNMRPLLKGIEKADSVILDAHKMLRTPTLCAAVLAKDARSLDLNFEHTASYLFHDKQQPGFDFIQQTVECTKAGLGLKFYFTLAAMGETGLESYLDQTCEVTWKAYQTINAADDFSCPYEPQSNILCFRIDGPDELQLEIRDRLIEQGQYYISSTMLNHRRYLRLVIISPNTGIEDIKNMIHKIRKLTAG